MDIFDKFLIFSLLPIPQDFVVWSIVSKFVKRDKEYIVDIYEIVPILGSAFLDIVILGGVLEEIAFRSQLAYFNYWSSTFVVLNVLQAMIWAYLHLHQTKSNKVWIFTTLTIDGIIKGYITNICGLDCAMISHISHNIFVYYTDKFIRKRDFITDGKINDSNIDKYVDKLFD